MRRVYSLQKTLMLGRDWGWEGLGTGGEGDDRGWDGWMASLTQWTWVWVNPGSWWWTGRPGVLRFMGSQRVGHDWATEPNWTKLRWSIWRRKWQSTPVLLPGKSHGQGSLVGYSAWGHKESDTIERLHYSLRWSIRASQLPLVIKNWPANAGSERDMGSIPGSGRSPAGEHGYPL